MDLVGKRVSRFIFGNGCRPELIGEERLRALFVRILELAENNYIFEGCKKGCHVEIRIKNFG